MIRFLNMIKQRGFFGTDNFHLYIKVHTKNDSGRAFNSLKVLYWKRNFFTFEKCCEILNTRNNVEVIQIFHEKFLDLESFLNDRYERPYPKTVNINHVLQVKRQSAHIGNHQEFHGKEESKNNYKKDKSYIGAHRKRRI